MYDKLENISEVWYNNNGTETKAYEYHYTAYGQLARFDNLLTGKSIAYKYDDDGRMIGFVEYDTDNADNLFSYTVFYDDRSRPSEVSYDFDYAVGSATANTDIQYEYFFNDPEGTLDEYKLTANGVTGTVEYTYDGLKRLSGKTFSVGETSAPQFTSSLSYTFLDSPWYDDQTSSFIGTVTSQVNNGTAVTTTYEYDYNGNITKIALSNGQEYRYVYDDLGQLLREDNTVLGKTYVYTYDDAGNILTKTTYALTAAGVTPSSPISTYNYGYTDANWGDKLTSYRGVSFTYDAIGNPLTYYNGSNYSFTWENGRQLATLTKGSNSLSFEYNDEGIRTQKTVNGVVHTYHLSDSQIIAEEWGDNLLLYLYDAEGAPIGMQYRKSSYAEGVFDTYWFEKNLQGDIVAVYDAEGIKLASYTYDAWGNCTITYHNGGTSTTATYNPFRYRGYYFDTETGFYYLNNRYYDPVIGRFISPDNVALLGANGDFASYNLYAYCGNNPISRADTNGHFWNFIVGAVVGGVVNGVVSAVTSYVQTGSVDLVSVGINVAVGAVGGLIAATGLGPLAQAGLTAVVSGTGNYAEQVYTKGFNDVNYADVVCSALVGGGTSLLGSAAGKLIGGNLEQTGTALLNKGKDKLLTGMVRDFVGQSHSSLLRQGTKYVAQGTKLINTYRAISSCVGSAIGAVTSSGYNAFKNGILGW